MPILSISTSSNNCSVAILEDNIIIKELNIENAKTHSETLMPLISQILKETNYALSQIDYLACDIGPGSFTGIRIGVSTIKAISEIQSIPIIPVSSLEGLSYLTTQTNSSIVTLIDARNDQAYCGIFDNNHSKKCEYIADSIDNIISYLKSNCEKITFVGNASILHHDLLKRNFPDANFIQAYKLSAGLIAKAAGAKKELCTADELVPLYLRKSQAERMQENAKN